MHVQQRGELITEPHGPWNGWGSSIRYKSPTELEAAMPSVVPVSILKLSTLSMPGGVSMVIQFTDMLPPPTVVKRAQRPNCHTAIGFLVVNGVHGPCVVPEAEEKSIPMPGPRPT
jgi:hypothetical protein